MCWVSSRPLASIYLISFVIPSAIRVSETRQPFYATLQLQSTVISFVYPIHSLVR